MKIEDTVRGFKEIVEGKHDDLPEQAFYMVGTIEEAREKARKDGRVGLRRLRRLQDRDECCRNTSNCEVVTPERHVLQETVKSVEIPGKEGYLGVLPGHAPLITELGIGVLTYRNESETRYLTVIDGYAEVLPDRVIVLAEISERAEEIDVPRTRAALDRAKAEVAKTSAGDPEWDRASFALQRALVRLQAASKTGAAGADEH